MKSRGNAACPCGQVLAGATLRPPRAQIVVGVLVKYVNLAKGWRHRLFVLQNGVLRYYKARAPWGVPIGAPLASSARRCGRRPSRAPAALPKAAAAPDAAPARRCSAPRASTCTRCWRACGSRATWCSSARRPASRRTSGYGAPALGPSASCARARACTALDWEARALPPARQPPSALQCAAVQWRHFSGLFVGQACRLDRQRRQHSASWPWTQVAEECYGASKRALERQSDIICMSALAPSVAAVPRARPRTPALAA